MKITLLAISLLIGQLSFAKCPNYWGRSAGKTNLDLPMDSINLESAAKLITTKNFRLELRELNNDCGNITWYQSNILNGLLEMYQATNNTDYLDQFVGLADDVYKQNDIFTGKFDKLRKRVVFGWSSIKYTKYKERHVMGVDSAVISEVYAKFTKVVLQNKLTTYYSKADHYYEVAKDAMLEIEEDWDEKINFYRFKPRAHKKYSIYPYNQGLAIASVYLELYEINKIQNEYHLAGSYLEKARLIGKYFKKAIKKDSRNNRLLWRYAPGSYYEDSSHASIDIEFMIKAYKNNILFSKTEMKLLATTVEKTFKRNSFARYIDGKDLAGYTSWHSLTCMRLMKVSQFSNKPRALLDKCRKVVSKIIANKNVLKTLPYQFYTNLVYGVPVLFNYSK